jgi:limonene-1,2-epoxide hydrolase
MGPEASNDELVRAMLSAWERRDTAFIMEHFTDDAVYQAMPLRPITGKAALAPWVESFEEVPPGRLEIRHQVASGNLVMNERVDRITLEGAEVTLPICAVFEVEDGRVRAWREYFDLAGIQSALRERQTSAE